jgi:hypothetical protein
VFQGYNARCLAVSPTAITNDFYQGEMYLMLKKTSLFFIAVVFLCSVHSVLAQEKPTTPEQKKQAVEMITFLETSPLAKEAKDYRIKLFTFIAAAPDITVTLCPGVIGDEKRRKGDYDSELVTFQLMFSQAKFIIENPDKAQDNEAVFLAGVEGVLKTWEAIKTAKPKAKYPLMDELLQMRHAGTFAEYVKGRASGCKGA